MAAVSSGGKTAGIFWIKDRVLQPSDEDQPMVFVPGVSKEGTLRSGAKIGSSGVRKGKVKMGNGSEVKGIMGVGCQLLEKKNRFLRPCCQAQAKTHAAEALTANAKAARHSSSAAGSSLRSPVLSPTKPTSIYVNAQALTKSAQARSSASLKDLCPEDKRRIANLIEELARVSEEKDETQQRLKDEQESFERKIQQLEQQNQLIVQERESFQQQYRECQELLGLYQQYLSQQQEKLNHSIAHLHHSHSKVSGSEGEVSQPARGGASGLEGSYLGLPTVGAAKRVQPRETWPVVDNNNRLATPTPPSSGSGRDGGRSQGRSLKRGGRGELRRGLCLENSEDKCEDLGESGPSPAPRRPARTPATAPPGGRVDWEERRNWLLLQKMELELQRERLQAQLAQQEERLFQHTQNLRQVRTGANRLRERGAEPTTDREAISGAADSDQTPRRAAGLGTVRGPSRGSEDVDRIAAQSGELLQRGEMAALPLQKPPQSYEASAVSRRDAATSPAAAQSQRSPAPRSTHGPAHPSTPSSRLHSSLIELLDVFSPISAPIHRRSRLTRNPRSPGLTSQLPPWGPADQAPPYCSPSVGVEEEESEILSDIFFIC